MIDRKLRQYALLSVSAAIVTIILKVIAYRITGSAGLFADALESGVNLLAAVTAFASLVYAARPADRNHAFGHEKIEYFSSGLEGVLIIIAGLVTVAEGVRRIINPEPLQEIALGLIVAGVAGFINLVAGYLILRAGRFYRSIVLEADGKHLLTDVWTTVAVLLGLGLVSVTGYAQIDAALAMIVGVHIIVIGLGLVHKSFNGLMDHALPDETQEQIRTIIRQQLPEKADFHMLRTRQAGRRRFADFHLLVPGDMTVTAGHQIVEEVEKKLMEQMPDITLSIHLEPIEEQCSWEMAELKALGEQVDDMPLSDKHPRH